MPGPFVFLDLNDDFYSHLRIPKLPLPVFTEDIGRVVRDDRFDFAIVTDRLA